VCVFIPTSKLWQSVSDIQANAFSFDPTVRFRFTFSSFDIDRSLSPTKAAHLSAELDWCLNVPSRLPHVTDECDFLQESPTPAALRSCYHTLCASSTNDSIIFNPSQVTCTNLFRFAGGKNVSEFDVEDLGELLSKRKATAWCVNDSAKLCHPCDEESHQGVSLSMRTQEFCPMHRGVLV
jgi:hypothetical protein